MKIYRCPSCKEVGMWWDARCGVFLCHNRKCAIAIDHPQDPNISNSEIKILITLNKREVTQDDLKQSELHKKETERELNQLS